MDLTTADENGTPWDFTCPNRRKAALAYIKQHRPLLIVGSPMCRMFSQMMRVNRKKMGELRYRRELQMQEGRYFVHEHPQQATSWDLPQVLNFIAKFPVHLVTNHQCMFGLRAKGADGVEGPAKKPTTWMTNAPWIADSLDQRCDGSHCHVLLNGGNRFQTK